MYTLDQIETLNLANTDRQLVSQLKRQLQDSFYYTSSKEVDSNGSSLKDRIGNQLTRYTDFLMDN